MRILCHNAECGQTCVCATHLHYEDIVTSIINVNSLLYEELQVPSVFGICFRICINHQSITLLSLL
jgi:hypothetical protein